MQRFIADPRDTATPDGAVRLLQRLYSGEALSAASTARLIAILETTSTGPDRIMRLLPAGTVVAHKTGTTGSASGLNAGTNGAGVITLPKEAGKLALAVFMKGSTRDLAAREGVIAQIASATFENSPLHQITIRALLE
jgi:beta-lactamase class A